MSNNTKPRMAAWPADTDRANDEKRFLAGLLQVIDCGLVQVARNMIWHRLMSARIDVRPGQ